jgi:hypothetical protein
LLTTNGMKKFLQELKLEPAEEKLSRHKSNWLRHVTGLNKKKDAKNNAEL